MSVTDLLEAAKRKVIGNPERLPRRAVMALLLLTLAIAVGGAWLAARTGIEASTTSSITYLRPALQIATSTWAYVVVLVILIRQLLLHRNHKYAEQAAGETGWQARSVRRIAYEAKSADGATRVIVTSDDEPEEIRERILTALETGEDDTLSLNPDAFAAADVDSQYDRYEALLEELEALEAEAGDLTADLDAGADELLGADLDPDAVGAALESGDDTHALGDLLDDDDRELRDDLEASQEELEANLEQRKEILAELEEIEAELDLDDEPAGRLGRAHDRLTRVGGWLWRRLTWPARAKAWIGDPREWRDRAEGLRLEDVQDDDVGEVNKSDLSRTDAGADQGAGEELSDPWREQLKLVGLDLSSSLSVGDMVWQALVPAALTIGAILLVLQIWIQPYLYPVVVAAGLTVGILNYVRVHWTRSRRLEALREERETVTWSDVGVLVKEVDVPETRIQYAWMGGSTEPRRYAHDDRGEFADEVALRAYELVNGVEVSPSIMSKQVTQLERMYPDLHGFRDAEKEQIMTWLLEHVESSQHGLIPKAKLIEDCIEHDLETGRWGPGSRGKGYDPELVREAYREIVPAALVEQEITVTRDGEQTLTAVRSREDPLPPEFGQIRAQFSSQFGNYARWSPMYELPDVTDQLDAEPTFASTIGYRGDSS